MYCHREYMETKTERLQVRMTHAEKARAQHAADEIGTSLSALATQALLRAADQILAERTTIRLTAEAAAAFTEALDRPGQVDADLLRALRSAPDFHWADPHGADLHETD